MIGHTFVLAIDVGIAIATLVVIAYVIVMVVKAPRPPRLVETRTARTDRAARAARLPRHRPAPALDDPKSRPNRGA